MDEYTAALSVLKQVKLISETSHVSSVDWSEDWMTISQTVNLNSEYAMTMTRDGRKQFPLFVALAEQTIGALETDDPGWSTKQQVEFLARQFESVYAMLHNNNYVINVYSIGTEQFVGTFVVAKPNMTLDDCCQMARLVSFGNPNFYYTVESANGVDILGYYKDGHEMPPE